MCWSGDTIRSAPGRGTAETVTVSVGDHVYTRCTQNELLKRATNADSAVRVTSERGSLVTLARVTTAVPGHCLYPESLCGYCVQRTCSKPYRLRGSYASVQGNPGTRGGRESSDEPTCRRVTLEQELGRAARERHREGQTQSPQASERRASGSVVTTSRVM